MRKELLQLVQEDASVFEAFMKCYKMPKATDLEKELRQIKIQEAAKMAAEIPLKIGEKALAVLLLAAEAAELGNPAVITDAAVAANEETFIVGFSTGYVGYSEQYHKISGNGDNNGYRAHTIILRLDNLYR